MSRTSSELQGMLFIGLVMFLGLPVIALVALSELTGHPFSELFEHWRELMIGPFLFMLVWVFGKINYQFPARLENTWPIILAAFWIGIHTLIVMSAQKEGVNDVLGYANANFDSIYHSDDWDELPFYAGNAFRWLVCALCVCGGYLARFWCNRNY